MQFPVELKVEMSQSGQTFGLAFHKPGNDKPLFVIKGCRLVGGQNGMFVSGPASKMNDGKWFNYLFMDKAFGEFVTKEVEKVAPKPSANTSTQNSDDSSDVPF